METFIARKPHFQDTPIDLAPGDVLMVNLLTGQLSASRNKGSGSNRIVFHSSTHSETKRFDIDDKIFVFGDSFSPTIEQAECFIRTLCCLMGFGYTVERKTDRIFMIVLTRSS